MNIFDYAMKMETDGKNFYLELAEKAPDEGVKNIFEMLARDEEKHYNAIAEAAEKEHVMADTEVLANAKNIFTDMQKRVSSLDLTADQAELYRKAQELEKKSRDFYQEKSREADKEHQRKLFEKLASEEQKHYDLLQNIIDLVERPQQWLEDAEWSHYDEY